MTYISAIQKSVCVYPLPYKADTPRETISEDRICNKRPDGIAIKMPTPEKAGEIVILGLKRMSDVTGQYVTRAKGVAIAQYASIK